MLLSLHIENIAVIRSVDIDFSQGFSALTGETGAGKSIIIDSLNLLLGKKADKELIRTGESTAMVSGLFGSFSEGLRQRLCDIGVSCDEEGNILIQRTLSRDGRSIVRINGRQLTLSVLQGVSENLLSIHGQSDTHSLTDPACHLAFLDTFSKTDALLTAYEEAYRKYDVIRREIKRVSDSERDRERMLSMLEYQIADIDALALHDGEEEELVERKVKLKSSERIRKNAGFVYKALKGSERGAAAYLLDRSITALEQISDVIPKAQEYTERLRDSLYQIEDIAEEAYAIADELDGCDGDINEIEERLDKISKIKRKYGLTIAEVLAFRERAAKEYEMLCGAEDRLAMLEKELKSSYADALVLAEKLHEARQDGAKRLESSVKETLDYLDMPKVVFFASIKEEYHLGNKVLMPNGTDHIEFYISANRGADAQPLAKIASGGELARIMLAIKCALADKDGIPTLIFDEIDAGVSGKTARKIGMKMHDLSALSQVLCVTHSAQIASLGDAHYLISKADINGKTETSVSLLDEEGRIGEISRILGGIQVTEAQRIAAIDMLSENRKQ